MADYPRDGQGEVQSLFCASFSGAVRTAYVIP